MAAPQDDDEKTAPIHLEYDSHDPPADNSIEDISTSWFVWLV